MRGLSTDAKGLARGDAPTLGGVSALLQHPIIA